MVHVYSVAGCHVEEWDSIVNASHYSCTCKSEGKKQLWFLERLIIILIFFLCPLK